MTMAKDKEYNKLIHTNKWLRLRRDVLTKHPICQRCEAEGRLTPATEVHHIRPVEEAFTKASIFSFSASRSFPSLGRLIPGILFFLMRW